MAEFLETNILIAALDRDRDEVSRLCEEMLPSERAAMRSALHLIDDTLEAM
ncbi:MAG: hypothetical protein WAV90_07250 [Gordonia amarae]